MDKKIKKVFLVSFIVIILLLLFFSVILSLININNTNILNGISINGIDISGLSKEDAISKVSKIIENKKNNNIIISSDSNVTTTFDYLEINYNINDAISRAYNIGRSSNIFQNNFEILNLIFKPENINFNIELNNDNLNSLINEISTSLPNKVIQSSYYIEDNNLVITNGSSGNIVNAENFTQDLLKALSDLSSSSTYITPTIQTIDPNKIDIDAIYNEIHKDVQDAHYEKNPFKIYPEVIGISFDKEFAQKLLEKNQDEYVIKLNYTYPKITINDLGIDTFKDKLSFFSTNYDMSNKDRTTNLELAAEKINGTILSPGEEFSYNTTVGARTISNGYKEAKIYSNGKVVDGIGGGICQISSTLYNAAMFANLNITTRYNHQFLTSYVAPGRDATVVYGVKDLKFINNRSYPIKIEMKISNGIVYCSFYGIKENTEYDVSFDTQTVSVTEPEVKYEYDNSLSHAEQKIKQSGAQGMTVNVYKVTKLDGTIISKELISQDIYNTLEKIVVKGQ